MSSNPTLDMHYDKEASFHDPAELEYAPPRTFKEKKEADAKRDCLKFILFALNFTICLIGGTVLGVGIWMAVDRSFLTYVIGNNLYAVSIYFVLIGGGLAFFVSFLGCCGAVTMNRCMLWTFLIILAVLAIVLFLGAILAVALQAQLGDSVKNTMKETLQNDYGVELHNFYNREVTLAWDRAQERLFCCGVEDNSWGLYRDSKWYELYGAIDVDRGVRRGNEDPRPYVPRSCCVRDRFYRYANIDVCQMWRLGPPGSSSEGAINRALYYDGCYEAAKRYLRQNSGVLIGLGLCLCLILILAIICTFFLLRSDRSSEKH